MPDKNFVGEPFWVLMEVSGGQLTGSYWARSEGLVFKKNYIPLFIAKSDATNFLSSLPDKSDYAVRGLPQHSLRFLLKTADIAKGKVKFSLMLMGPDENGMWPGLTVTPEEVECRFLISTTH